MNLPEPSRFYGQVKNSARLYSNLPSILEKVESDGHLVSLGKAVAAIIASELSFASAGFLIRAKKNGRTRPGLSGCNTVIQQFDHL